MTANIISSTSQQTTLDNVIAPEEVNAPSCVSPFIIKYETAIASFNESIAKDDSYTESHKEKFLRTMRFVESHYGSWNFRTVVINAGDFLQIGNAEMLHELFTQYIEVMLKFHKVTAIDGCDGIVYVMQ